jgi:hypothetical protein
MPENDQAQVYETVILRKRRYVMVMAIWVVVTVVVLHHMLLLYNPALAEGRTYDISFCILAVSAFVLHEVTHALSVMAFGKLRVSDITFGIVWKYLMPYCGYKRPVTVRVFRISLLAPLVGTALPCFLVFHFYPVKLTSMLFCWVLPCSYTDLYALFLVRHFPGTHWVIGDPSHTLAYQIWPHHPDDADSVQDDQSRTGRPG